MTHRGGEIAGADEQAVDAVDKYTVKFDFGRPFPGVFRMLCQFKGGHIVAKEAVEQQVQQKAYM